MLTRLKVSGFKNLVDVDVRFGAFTCVAGANGVGKSNLFDAIRFLSALSNTTLMEAALSVREEGGKANDIQSLFLHVGDWHAPRISFEAEMIVPDKATDDLGQEAQASITFLRYKLTLKLIDEKDSYISDSFLTSGRDKFISSISRGVLQIEHEELNQINLSDASSYLRFPHSRKWRQSVVKGRRITSFISTEKEDSGNLIKVHQDGRQGRALRLLASTLPRTVLSASNAAENPTVLVARREMQSWRLLQLESSALRKPDEFNAPARLATNGRHLPATLYRLAHKHSPVSANGMNIDEAETTYIRIANRLSELIDDLHGIRIDRDVQRELLTLYASGRDGTAHPARSLSDGTLRFLALAVLEMDPEAQGLICLEEPENGIHPSRIPAMLRLLQDIACDTEEAVDEDNPMRQVIVNTHSPSVVTEVPDDSLVLAKLVEHMDGSRRYKQVQFAGLSGTWRAQGKDAPIVSKGDLLAYLAPFTPPDDNELTTQANRSNVKKRRVADRPDLQMLLFPQVIANLDTE